MTREEILKVAKPILFNTEMVRAILEGRKTVTRRLLKDPWYIEDEENARLTGCAMHKGTKITKGMPYPDSPLKVGDNLYVRETWRVGAWDIHKQLMAFDYKDGTCGEMVYIHDRDMFLRLVDQAREDARKAGCEYNGVDFVWEKGKSPCKWHPSIHMPKEAARIFILVTNVKVERLQDITFKEVKKEGVFPCIGCRGLDRDFDDISYCKLKDCKYGDKRKAPCSMNDFVKLWNSTIKKEDMDKYGWDANPWVWVYEFERVEV